MATRTQNSVRNIFTGLAGKIIVFVFAFLTRTVFARLLGAEYSGVDGLYANILSVLSLADLGVNNVFTFFLYKSLAEKDEERTASVVKSFQKLYIGIGLFILLGGMVVVPFLPLIVNSALPQNEIILYYILYLVNASASYFFAYKTIVLTADQKKYIDNICTTVFQILMYLAQFVYLLLTHDFLGYLIIQIVTTVLRNVVMTFIAEKKYPYLAGRIKTAEYPLGRGVLWNNIKATFLYKICIVLINNTDNILISILIGTVYVGKYAYYCMLVQYADAYIYLFATSILASIGNLNAEKDEEKAFRFFKTLNLIFAAMAIVVVCGFSNCIQEFIPIWIGTDFLLGNDVVVAMLLSSYLTTLCSPVWMYRETMGLFREVQYSRIPTVIINIGLSIVLGKYFGIAGILFATSIAKLSTNLWFEPVVLYRRFGKKVRGYFLMQAGFALVTLGSVFVTRLICRYLPTNLIGIVLRAVVSISVSLLILVLVYGRTEAGKDAAARIKTMFMRKRRGNGKHEGSD